MNYYRIRHADNLIEFGVNPQIKDVIYSGKVTDPKFIGKIVFKKIDFDPVIPMPRLRKKANLTDLIEYIATNPFNLMISNKLKSLLEPYSGAGIQYFKSSVFHNGVEYDSYWLINAFDLCDSHIDFDNSLVLWEKQDDNFESSYLIKPVTMRTTYEEFEKMKVKARKKAEVIYISKLALKNIEEDFFALRYIEGGAGFFVSEKLKTVIEEAGSTGLEFQPSYLSYTEWIARGGEREKVYSRSW